MTDRSLQIVGRTGSLFTRLPLLFAEELDIHYDFVSVEDLASHQPADYAGNPALRIPVMRDLDTVLYGAQNICRALVERAVSPARIVWPEELDDDLSRNAHELLQHCMAAQVQILMHRYIGKLPADNVVVAKAPAGLEGALGWLNENVHDVLQAMPQTRDLSFFEVALYCLVDHLRFAETVNVADYPALLAVTREFSTRPSALRTPYR